MNEYQKQFDMFLKVFVYLLVIWWLLGLLRFLPDDLSDRIVNLLLGRWGLENENHAISGKCQNAPRGPKGYSPKELARIAEAQSPKRAADSAAKMGKT